MLYIQHYIKTVHFLLQYNGLAIIRKTTKLIEGGHRGYTLLLLRFLRFFTFFSKSKKTWLFTFFAVFRTFSRTMVWDDLSARGVGNFQ